MFKDFSRVPMTWDDLKETPVNAAMFLGGVLAVLGLFLKELYRVFSVWSVALVLMAGVFLFSQLHPYRFNIVPKQKSFELQSFEEPRKEIILDAESLKDSGLEPLGLE